MVIMFFPLSELDPEPCSLIFDMKEVCCQVIFFSLTLDFSKTYEIFWRTCQVPSCLFV